MACPILANMALSAGDTVISVVTRRRIYITGPCFQQYVPLRIRSGSWDFVVCRNKVRFISIEQVTAEVFYAWYLDSVIKAHNSCKNDIWPGVRKNDTSRFRMTWWRRTKCPWFGGSVEYFSGIIFLIFITPFQTIATPSAAGSFTKLACAFIPRSSRKNPAAITWFFAGCCRCINIRAAMGTGFR